MSYILDALNKSEQERRGNELPGLGTVHRRSPTDGAGRNTSKWLIAFIVIGALNAVLFAWWINRSPATAVSIPAQAESEAAPTSMPTPSAPAIREKQISTPVAPERRAAQPAPGAAPMPGEILITPQDLGRSQSNPIAEKPAGVQIGDLPPEIQRQIPDLVFSSHIYADDPSFRVVNINGRGIREGDLVTSDIRLLEITEEGVVLNFLNYTFEVSVLRDWTFN